MDKIEDEIARVAATVAATEAAAMQRIEIVGERRRAHDAAFRARMVAASMVPGTRIRDLARQAWDLREFDLSLATRSFTAGGVGLGGSAGSGACDRTTADQEAWHGGTPGGC